MADKATLQDMYQVSYPDAKNWAYGQTVAGLTRQAMLDVIKHSLTDPTTFKPDDEATITYTVTVTVNGYLAGTNYQHVTVTVAETGISE